MKASDRTSSELRALQNVPDSKIDTGDIPERTDWTGAKRGRFLRDIAKSSRTAPLTDQQKSIIRRALSEGTSSGEIAARVGVAPAQVRAVKAHVGMSTYNRGKPGPTTSTQPISHEWLIRLQARKRSDARKRGINFELEPADFVVRLFDEQGGRCAVSGIEFNLRPYNTLVKCPFAPSLDRKVSRLGYTRENVRLVCVVVNFALNEWGDEPFLTVAHGAVAWEKRATNSLSDVGPDEKWQTELRQRIVAAEDLLRLLPPGLQGWQRRHIAGLKAALTKGLAGSRAAAAKAKQNRTRKTPGP